MKTYESTVGGSVKNVYTARRRLEGKTKTRRETGDGTAYNDITRCMYTIITYLQNKSSRPWKDGIGRNRWRRAI